MFMRRMSGLTIFVLVLLLIGICGITYDIFGMYTTKKNIEIDPKNFVNYSMDNITHGYNLMMHLVFTVPLLVIFLFMYSG